MGWIVLVPPTYQQRPFETPSEVTLIYIWYNERGFVGHPPCADPEAPDRRPSL